MRSSSTPNIKCYTAFIGTPAWRTAHNSKVRIIPVGLTRAAGVVCPIGGALTTTIVLAATDPDWIIRRSRRIIVEICTKKLPCELAEREAPDAVAPTHSTASRNLFARLAESFRYFKRPQKYNTHKPKIRATRALVVLFFPPHRTAAPAVPPLMWERVSPTRFSFTDADPNFRNLADRPVRPRRQTKNAVRYG